MVADARGEALRMRAETDDYVDASLARFEALLEHTLATVGRGRDKLRQMSDSALQQQFPDPDGEVGMPAASPVGIDEALGVPEVELSQDPELPAAVQSSSEPTSQPTLSGELLGEHGPDQSALAR
jgi:hypothetical protein